MDKRTLPEHETPEEGEDEIDRFLRERHKFRRLTKEEVKKEARTKMEEPS